MLGGARVKDNQFPFKLFLCKHLNNENIAALQGAGNWPRVVPLPGCGEHVLPGNILTEGVLQLPNPYCPILPNVSIIKVFFNYIMAILIIILSQNVY